MSQLHRRGLGGSSIQRGLSAARSFFNYLGREQGRPRNPAASVQAPRKPRKLPKALDADQVNKYLEFTDDTVIARRDRAMAELFYSSGLRLAELAAVNIGDIDRHARLLTVTGVISAAKEPSSIARWARSTEAMANASCASREKRYLSAHISPNMPIICLS